MEPARSYVICCVQRTGSWLLAHTLADTGLEFMRATFPAAQFVWLRRADKVRQGISWWRADATGQWVLRPDQEAGRPAPDVERIVRLVRFAEQCEDGWRQWFASTGIQPCEVSYEDLARKRLGGRDHQEA
jgi:LPS sulfotransferase NodH